MQFWKNEYMIYSLHKEMLMIGYPNLYLSNSNSSWCWTKFMNNSILSPIYKRVLDRDGIYRVKVFTKEKVNRL